MKQNYNFYDLYTSVQKEAQRTGDTRLLPDIKQWVNRALFDLRTILLSLNLVCSEDYELEHMTPGDFVDIEQTADRVYYKGYNKPTLLDVNGEYIYVRSTSANDVSIGVTIICEDLSFQRQEYTVYLNGLTPVKVGEGTGINRIERIDVLKKTAGDLKFFTSGYNTEITFYNSFVDGIDADWAIGSVTGTANNGAAVVNEKLELFNTLQTDQTMFISYLRGVNGNLGVRADAGDLDGTAVGGAAVENEKLNLKGGTVQYVDYEADGNADSQQVGCIRFEYTPNYTTSPAGDRTIVTVIKADSESNNLIHLRHQATGNIQLLIIDSADDTIMSASLGDWSPTAGVEYEIELNWNLNDIGGGNGATRFFISGTQFGATQTGIGTRDGNIGILRFGSNYNHVNAADGEIRNVEIFSAVQHTANYAPQAVTYKQKYVGYEPESNIDMILKGAIRLNYTPKYAGKAAEDQYIVSTSKAADDVANLIELKHKADGDLEIVVNNSVGVEIINQSVSWGVAKDTEYEIEVNFDIESNDTNGDKLHVFIDGSEVIDWEGTSPLVRNDELAVLNIGRGIGQNDRIECLTDNLMFFNDMQHITGYVPTIDPVPSSFLFLQITAGVTVLDYTAYEEVIRTYDIEKVKEYIQMKRMTSGEPLDEDLDYPELPGYCHEAIRAGTLVYLYSYAQENDLLKYWQSEYKRLKENILVKQFMLRLTDREMKYERPGINSRDRYGE